MYLYFFLHLVLMIKSPEMPTILPTFFTNKIDALRISFLDIKED